MKGQAGISLVEFTFALVIVVLLVGGIFDFGLGLHQYSILGHTTQKAAREISTRLATRPKCEIIKEYINEVAQKEMSAVSTNGKLTTWAYQTISNNGPLRLIEVRGTLPLNCYFICKLIPTEWSVTSSSTASLDSSISPSCQGTVAPETE